MHYEYIAIEGNIGAGKTSLAKRLAKDNDGKLVLEEFADNPFLPKFYQNKERYAFPLELSFIAERFTQLKNELGSKDLFQSLVVADYFISKSLIFSKANLAGDEYNLFAKLFSMIEQTLPQPELLVYLYKDTDKLLENIKKRGRDYEQEITADYLDELQNSYFEFLKQQDDLRVLVIETNELDFVNSEVDYQSIVTLINSDYPKGISRVST